MFLLNTGVSNALVNRTLSSFGISIGTGLALESVFTPTTERYDVTREIPNIVDMSKFKYHVFNIYTLLRNIVSATDFDKVRLYESKELKEVLIEEIETLKLLYDNIETELVIWVPDYKDAFITFNQSKKKTMSRPYIDYMSGRMVTKKIGKDDIPVKYIESDHKLDLDSSDVLITTHITLDLLNIKRIKNLTLLESNTGLLRDKYKWYNKYHSIGKRDMSFLPFNDQLLFLLGDKSLVKPGSISARVELYDMAINKKWTPRTTRDKIRENLKECKLALKVLLDYKNIY